MINNSLTTKGNIMLPKYGPRFRPTSFDDLFGEGTENLFNSMFKMTQREEGYHLQKQEDGTNVLCLEVPGFNKENLKITLLDGLLKVAGKQPTTGKSVSYSYKLGDIKNVKAEVKDGLLTIRFSEYEKVESEIPIE